MKFGQTEIPGSLFDLARERMLRDDSFTPFDIRTYLATAGQEELSQVSDIRQNHWVIANRVMRACIEQLDAAGEISQFKRGVWLKKGATPPIENQVSDEARLHRARASWERASAGKWSWNCAGEVLMTVDGKEVVIGSFNGCAADAEAVCRLHNNAASLFERAGITEEAVSR